MDWRLFYFVFLDSSLVAPKGDNPDRVSGELWAVHGGGFYHARKFMGAPPFIGGHLHWFYWESYVTWLSRLCLARRVVPVESVNLFG